MAALVVSAACAGRPTGAPGAPEQTVTVSNHSYEDIVVYAIPCGAPDCPIRIGTVRGNASERLRLAKGMFGGGRTLYLYVKSPLGHFAYQLPPALPAPEQSVYVTVDVRSSQVVVR